MKTTIDPSQGTRPRHEAKALPTVHWPMAAALSVCLLAVWVAASARQAPEPPRPVPAVTLVVPYHSPFPAPCVDPATLPDEPAPTF
jgi:hypothetical protein